MLFNGLTCIVFTILSILRLKYNHRIELQKQLALLSTVPSTDREFVQIFLVEPHYTDKTDMCSAITCQKILPFLKQDFAYTGKFGIVPTAGRDSDISGKCKWLRVKKYVDYVVGLQRRTYSEEDLYRQFIKIRDKKQQNRKNKSQKKSGVDVPYTLCKLILNTIKAARVVDYDRYISILYFIIQKERGGGKYNTWDDILCIKYQSKEISEFFIVENKAAVTNAEKYKIEYIFTLEYLLFDLIITHSGQLSNLIQALQDKLNFTIDSDKDLDIQHSLSYEYSAECLIDMLSHKSESAYSVFIKNNSRHLEAISKLIYDMMCSHIKLLNCKRDEENKSNAYYIRILGCLSRIDTELGKLITSAPEKGTQIQTCLLFETRKITPKENKHREISIYKLWR